MVSPTKPLTWKAHMSGEVVIVDSAEQGNGREGAGSAGSAEQ